MTAQITLEAFLQYMQESRSKNTLIQYQHGIEAFVKWFGKSANEILELRKQDFASEDIHQKKRFAREIEKFHKHLIETGYTINTARTMTIGIQQLFRFYEMPITMLSREVSKTVPTTKDFVPTTEQYRAMYQVASDLRSKLIISMGKDLAWRIGDFAKIRKDMLPNLEQDAPIPFDVITEKEDVLAKSFLSQETADLLREYLPVVQNNTNPYLFPSNGNGFYDPESINRTLRELAEKAQVKIPQRKHLRFHAFRKRFLSTCADLHIDVNTAKILCGKDVEQSMLTYLSEVEHREAFIKAHERLRLTEIPMRKTRETASELEKKVDRLERMINLIGAINPEIVRRADDMLASLNVTMKAETFIEKLDLIVDAQDKKRNEEYARMIAENNNNHN